MAPVVKKHFSKPVDPQTGSLFFKNLPAELRNKIYELVQVAKTTGDPSKGESTIDLKLANPPTGHLPATCQRLHAESHTIFKTAYLDYWRH